MPQAGFDDVCDRLAVVLGGTFRRDVVEGLAGSTSVAQALTQMRHAMRSHIWKAGVTRIDLAAAVETLDARTRADGFHALHDWDGIADHVNEDTIPVDVLSFMIDQRGRAPFDALLPAVLLDYYLLHLLALMSLRIWDEGQPDAHLDRLDGLLRELQGERGSGQPFVDNAATLILLATSHYELHERGYHTLLERVRALSLTHREAIALGHASSLGCHLRFGFEATYGRDLTALRGDNATDYPWLWFSIATLLDAYAREPRPAIAEALLNAFTPDAAALTSAADPSNGSSADLAECTTLWRRHQAALVDAFDRHRPTAETYSPLAFYFNFSHNVVKGIVIDALLRGDVWPVTLNDLLCGGASGRATSTAKIALANTLMAYARAYPHRIRGRLTPVIVYDPPAGGRACAAALRNLRNETPFVL